MAPVYDIKRSYEVIQSVYNIFMSYKGIEINTQSFLNSFTFAEDATDMEIVLISTAASIVALLSLISKTCIAIW